MMVLFGPEITCQFSYPGFPVSYEANPLVLLLQDKWDVQSQTWKNDLKYSYTYDETGRPLEVGEWKWSDSTSRWQFIELINFTYDDQGRLIRHTIHLRSGQFIHGWEETHTYTDAYEEIIRYRYYDQGPAGFDSTITRIDVAGNWIYEEQHTHRPETGFRERYRRHALNIGTDTVLWIGSRYLFEEDTWTDYTSTYNIARYDEDSCLLYEERFHTNGVNSETRTYINDVECRPLIIDIHEWNIDAWDWQYVGFDSFSYRSDTIELFQYRLRDDDEPELVYETVTVNDRYIRSWAIYGTREVRTRAEYNDAGLKTYELAEIRDDSFHPWLPQSEYIARFAYNPNVEPDEQGIGPRITSWAYTYEKLIANCSGDTGSIDLLTVREYSDLRDENNYVLKSTMIRGECLPDGSKSLTSAESEYSYEFYCNGLPREQVVVTDGTRDYRKRFTFLHSGPCTGEIEDDLVLYPNPGNGTLYIESSIAQQPGARLQIFSTDGRLVHSENIPHLAGVIDLDLTAQISGMYFVLITDANGSSQQSGQYIKLD